MSGRATEASSTAHADVQENLQQLDRLANLGLFSAGIAHEIKNGLVAINTFCEFMLQKEDNQEMADLVRRELKRIDGLATQMSRLAAPKPATLAPVNVHDLLDLTLRLTEHQVRERMIMVRRDFRAAPCVVQGDESRLQQAILNLTLNAIEAMGPGGQLTLLTETVGGKLKISVRDTGAGIAPQNFAHIFDTFFTTKKHGTGLGLAISRRLVEDHHGTIEVQSQVGRGSTFCITLPMQ